jgi:Domain of unknown function (DUF4440)
MSGEQSAQGLKMETETALRQLSDEWVKALVRRDVASLDRIMADDFFFAYPFEGDDKDEFISNVVSGDLVVEYVNREHVGVRIWDSTAIVTARDSAKWFYQRQEWSGNYKIIQVYACRNDEWNLVAVQACHIP